MRELGQRIRTAREELGLSQEEFAARIERDQRAVSEYENGHRRIWVTDLPVIAQALGMPLSYFYEGKVTEDGLDTLLLDEFHRLPTDGAKQTAIKMLRLFHELFK